ncbi:MAG TPA: DUF3152 domain-containing protein [Micromonosporaceae bacterium]
MVRVVAPISRRVWRAGAAALTSAAFVALTVYFVIVVTGGTTVQAATAPPLPAPDAVPATAVTAWPSKPSPIRLPTTFTLTPTSPRTVPPTTPSSTGKWRYANTSASYGSKGPLRTFRIAVENNLSVSVTDFTAKVRTALFDPRSWAGNGDVHWHLVPGSSSSNFTIYLASPSTAYTMCRSGGLDIRRNGVPYTSCRVGAMVVINYNRYLHNASAFANAGGSLTAYREMVINHEVGHYLGHGHLHCPGSGKLAPVMQQQTLDMQGCKPNPWPYPKNA